MYGDFFVVSKAITRLSGLHALYWLYIFLHIAVHAIELLSEQLKPSKRPDGEIGKHSRLKICRLCGLAGSIPARGTNHIVSSAAICARITQEARPVRVFCCPHVPVYPRLMLDMPAFRNTNRDMA